MSTLPDVRVGDPIRHESLTVFPLFSPPEGGVDYLLSDEAIRAGSVTVEEVSEGGSVPDLLVTNPGDSRVLFLEGEELRGAKQNRVLNTSVLVAAHSKTASRSVASSRAAGDTGAGISPRAARHSSSKLRHILKKSVYRVDQGRPRIHLRPGGGLGRGQPPDGLLGSSSETAAMSDTYETLPGPIDRVSAAAQVRRGGERGWPSPSGRRSSPWTCSTSPRPAAKVWDRLLSGVIMDALEGGPER